VAGINGQSNKKKEKKMYGHPVRSANERVYVSAVADRVNVGKDEGLRFSGWIELERKGWGQHQGRIRVARTGDSRFEGGGKNFALLLSPPRVHACGVIARVCAPAHIFMRYITYSGKWHVAWFTAVGIRRWNKTRERMAPRDSWVMHLAQRRRTRVTLSAF